MTTDQSALAVCPAPSLHAIDSLQIFSTCPSSSTAPERYLERIAEVSRWSEKAGCTGILIYTDNSLVDPWLVSQVVMQSTRSLSPLVAVQPVYMHPYSVAKMVATLGFLHHRQVLLNMVAGGFTNDLAALHDKTPHDLRYQRLVEYTTVIRQLLEARSPVTFEGQFYQVRGLTLKPPLAPDLWPDILVSGSSPAGLAAAGAMGAIAVKYPEPLGDGNAGPLPGNGRCGVRIGIVARRREGDAWMVAQKRFPENRQGQLTRQLATKVSDSAWHKRLSETGKTGADSHGTYWLHPFENYQTNCPYLVGSYERVGEELARYIVYGYRTFILDIPPTEEELDHIGVVFETASRKAGV